MSFFSHFSGLKRGNKTYGDASNAINKNTSLISKHSAMEEEKVVYYQTLQNMFQQYLISQSAYYALYCGKVSLDQVNINNVVNETFFGYIQRLMANPYSTTYVCDAQKFGDISAYNPLTYERIDQNELSHDCYVLSDVYEGLLATITEKVQRSGGELDSHTLYSLSGVFDKSFNKSPEFFGRNNYFRGEENTGEIAFRHINILAENKDPAYLMSLDLIYGASVGFENVVQERYCDFLDVASASPIGEQ